MNKTVPFAIATALSLAAAAAIAATPSGKGIGVADGVKAYAAAGAQILYHGGPIMNKTTGVNVYLIWYGNWAGNTATTIVPKFITDLSGSAYFNINTTYHDGSSVFIKNIVNLKGQSTDAYSQGSALSDVSIQNIVKRAITTRALPKDTNGLYFVLTSKDVNETSGFCTQYCGWHNHATAGGGDFKYSFVGDAARCLSACSIQTTSPNNNAGADAMLSVIGHELEETVTDEDLNAWYFASGAENADQCAWTFGTTFVTSNGSSANMTMNGSNYMIQQNWIQSSAGKCAVAYP